MAIIPTQHYPAANAISIILSFAVNEIFRQITDTQADALSFRVLDISHAILFNFANAKTFHCPKS